MPKPITYILLEKKEELEFNYESFYNLIDNLEATLNNIIIEIKGIKSVGSEIFGSSSLDSLEETCNKYLEKIHDSYKKQNPGNIDFDGKIKIE
jgi:hypothetical protein